jgi:hypothetical protein
MGGRRTLPVRRRTIDESQAPIGGHAGDSGAYAFDGFEVSGTCDVAFIRVRWSARHRATMGARARGRADGGSHLRRGVCQLPRLLGRRSSRCAGARGFGGTSNSEEQAAGRGDVSHGARRLRIHVDENASSAKACRLASRERLLDPGVFPDSSEGRVSPPAWARTPQCSIDSDQLVELKQDESVHFMPCSSCLGMRRK